MDGPDGSQSLRLTRVTSNVLTLISSAPSTLPVDELTGSTNPLRLAWTTIELGLETDEDACDPSRSSGSHNNCCMRLIPSWDTRGRDGNLRDCFQFKIFCRVTWRWRKSYDFLESKGSFMSGTHRITDERRVASKIIGHQHAIFSPKPQEVLTRKDIRT